MKNLSKKTKPIVFEIEEKLKNYHQLINNVKKLIEDYERKIKSCNDILQDEKSNSENKTRIETKKSQYKTFIVELKRLLK